MGSAFAYAQDYPWDSSRKITALRDLYSKSAPPNQSEMHIDFDPAEYNAKHPALGSTNRRVLGYERKVVKGAVVYIGLGHCTQKTDKSATIPNKGAGYKGPWTLPV